MACSAKRHPKPGAEPIFAPPLSNSTEQLVISLSERLETAYGVTKMGFLDIAVEIRLMIYSELLVLSKPIEFSGPSGSAFEFLWAPKLPWSPPLLRLRGRGLCTALLRVSKKVHLEAAPLLYSQNCFRFSDLHSSGLSVSFSFYIAPFLDQIGSQASFIRHICIPLPTFPGLTTLRDYRLDKTQLPGTHIRTLDLIRDNCTSIHTLELLVGPLCADSAVRSTEVLAGLDTRLRAMQSLKEIIINFELCPGQELSDDIKKRAHDNHGWTVMVTRVPRKSLYKQRISDEEQLGI